MGFRVNSGKKYDNRKTLSCAVFQERNKICISGVYGEDISSSNENKVRLLKPEKNVLYKKISVQEV